MRDISRPTMLVIRKSSGSISELLKGQWMRPKNRGFVELPRKLRRQRRTESTDGQASNYCNELLLEEDHHVQLKYVSQVVNSHVGLTRKEQHGLITSLGS